MMRQYFELKKKAKDAVLFFRLGDFYEMFGDDALLASRILDITLTSRNKGESKVPMCGVPYHSAESYIAKLTKAGQKVAVCEQVSDPSLPGLVKRRIIRIITPGTTFSANVLDQKQSNFVISIYFKKEYFGLAVCDITTADFRAVEIMGFENLRNELIKLAPKECIIESRQYDKYKDVIDKIRSAGEIYIYKFCC